MIHKHIPYYIQHIKDDIPAGLVVFLVALPLCLGVALASGAPLFAGLIAGMVGGLVVAWLSGSQLSVSGPAAGLTVIVFNGIEVLGSFQGFLLAVVLAGILQLLFGFLKAGIIGAFFPSSVIKGMLAAIGLILIIKQVPHAVGYDSSFEGDESYMMETVESSMDELLGALSAFSLPATIISVLSLLILLTWDSKWVKDKSYLAAIPAPLLVVIFGISFDFIANLLDPSFAVSPQHLVSLPASKQLSDFFSYFMLPDFSYLTNPKIYSVAITMAIIASLETLLSLEATDKLDPLKRIAPTNRELKAQGIGNILSGLLGGLPITAVIVRSSANINAGGKTSMSCFVHGIFLLLSILFFAEFLNTIPLSCLSAILLHTGYKLAKPALFKEHYQKGMGQFLPFVLTVVAIIATDLLIGIAIGMAIGLLFVMRANYHAAISLTQDGSHYLLAFHKDVSFLNKATLRKFILYIKENSTVVIDARKANFIDHDILELIDNFIATATDDNIKVELIDLYGKESINTDHNSLIVLKTRLDEL